MKKLILLITLVFSINYAQEKVEWQNPLPHGNAFYSLSFINKDTGYALTSEDKIFYTSDGGETWKEKKTVTSDSMVSGKTIKFLSADTGFVYQFFTHNKGLYITQDGGESWRILDSSLQNCVLQAYPSNKVGYYFSYSGIVYKTTDGGLNFDTSSIPYTNPVHTQFISENSGWVNVDRRKLIETNDGCSSWIKHRYLPDSKTGGYFYFKDSLNGWWAGDSSNYFRTADGGTTFVEYPAVKGKTNAIHFNSSGEGWLINSYFDFSYNREFYSLHYTSDSGANWTPIITLLPKLNLVEIVDENTAFVAGASGKFFRTTNCGKTWEAKFQGTGVDLIDVWFTSRDTGIVIGDRSTILRTTDAGKNWNIIQENKGYDLRGLFFLNDTTGWAVGGGGKILKTSDNGVTWFTLPAPSPDYLNGVSFVNEDTGWVGGKNGNVYKTTDGGTSWSMTTLQPPNDTIETISDIWMKNDTTGWITTYNYIYKTTDAGITWVALRTTVTASYYQVYFRDSLFGYIAGNVSYVTSDGGETWKDYKTGARSCFISPTSGFTCYNTLLVFNNAHMQKTNDGGETWTILKDHVTNRFKSIFFLDSTLGWFVGNGGMIMKYEITKPNSTEDEFVSAATSYELQQNYPNPFNPVTTIKYAIPERKLVTLKVYDVLGKEIALLVNEEESPGQHEVKFNAGKLSSGIYFYRIQAGEYIQTKKMILLK